MTQNWKAIIRLVEAGANPSGGSSLLFARTAAKLDPPDWVLERKRGGGSVL